MQIERSRFDPSENLGSLARRLETESSDGLLLLSNPADNPICSVGFDPGIPCVRVVWKRYATSTQMRFINEHVLSLIRRHRVSAILADDTHLPTIHTEDRIWVVEDWMPRAIAAGLRHVASKCSTAYFGKLSTEEIGAMAPPPLTIRFFPTLEEARA